MAYAVKYRGEFSDNEGEDWKVEILEDAFSGTVTTMQMAGDPLSFDWPSETDNCYDQNIRGSAVSINVYCETDFAYSELFTSDNLEYKVNIYHGTTLFWSGWITANSWNEPYSLVPYPITISATDGLGLLKDMDFTDLSLTGRQTHSKIIHDILEKIGIDNFTEYINVYESTMDSAVSDSPLDQAGADTDLWEESTMYEALTDILKMYDAAIIQYGGEIVIYRYLELPGTMYGRAFTSPTAKTATTTDVTQFINRSTTASNFIEHGGTLMIAPQVKELILTQDYGAKDSILKTWEFNFEDFTGSATSWDVSDWTESGTPDPRPIALAIQAKGEDPGVYLHSVRAASGVTGHNIYQSIDVLASATDGFVVDFEWALINSSSVSQTLRIDIEISIDEAGTTYYFDGTQWTSISTTIPETANILTIDAASWTGWTNYQRAIETSKAGPLSVRIFAVVESGSATSVYVAVKNMKVKYTNSDGQIVESLQYNVTNAVNGQVIEKEYVLGDGDDLDNVLIMSRGAVNVYSGATAVATSRSWSTRGGGEADPIIELVGGEIGNQFSRPKHILDLEIYEQSNDFFTLIGHLQDDLNQYLGFNRKFIINRATYDVRMRKWSLSLNELI